MTPRAASLWLLASGAALACGAPPPPGPDLVVVSLDTVRRDHLPTHGYPQPTAPRLEAFARRAVVFDNAFSQEVNTNPSHASMFTGLYPHVHGNRRNGQRLSRRQTTLAQILRRHRLRTAAFVSGYTLHSEVSGLDRGFEIYEEDFEGQRRPGRQTLARALAWLREREPDERFFAFVHLYDAHGPYRPGRRYARLFRSPDPGPEVRVPRYQQMADLDGTWLMGLQGYVDRYDAMIRDVDDRIGELLDALDLSETIVVILSDHGETLSERYQALDHGGQTFDEQTRIALVVYAPGIEPRRVPDLVETVDLLPTLLELMGLPSAAGLQVQGRSLVPLLRGETIPARSFVFSSAQAISQRHADRRYELREDSSIHSVRSRAWKLILYPGMAKDYVELYDLERDPRETVNRAEAEPEIRERYLGILEDWLARGEPEGSFQPLSAAQRERLRALGYALP